MTTTSSKEQRLISLDHDDFVGERTERNHAGRSCTPSFVHVPVRLVGRAKKRSGQSSQKFHFRKVRLDSFQWSGGTVLTHLAPPRLKSWVSTIWGGVGRSKGMRPAGQKLLCAGDHQGIDLPHSFCMFIHQTRQKADMLHYSWKIQV